MGFGRERVSDWENDKLEEISGARVGIGSALSLSSSDAMDMIFLSCVAQPVEIYKRDM